nr:PilW family protein [uncultured Rhodoferax sp.]
MKHAQLAGRQRGVTLIELMIGILIGAILSLVMLLVMKDAEGRKRTLTSSNDLNQAGNYTANLFNQWVRNAGNGFSQAAPYTFGCPLKARYTSGSTETLILPRTAALPAPFSTVVSTVGSFRLAPVLILPNQTTPSVSGANSDMLIVMGGTSSTGGTAAAFSSYADAATINVPSNQGFQANDIVLAASLQPSSANYNTAGTAVSSITMADCVIEQVSASLTSTNTLPLAGAYHSANNSVDSLSLESSVMSLGNVANGNAPQLVVLGVGDNNTLFSYDLLSTATSSTARAEGVFEIHALYGVDANCDGTISSDEWGKPTASPYTVSELMTGYGQEQVNWPASSTARTSNCATLTTANDHLQRILAIRIGLILRTSRPEKDVVTTNSITLFPDLATAKQTTRTLKSDTEDSTRLEQHYRYRIVDIKIPLRNALTIL